MPAFVASPPPVSATLTAEGIMRLAGMFGPHSTSQRPRAGFDLGLKPVAFSRPNGAAFIELGAWAQILVAGGYDAQAEDATGCFVNHACVNAGDVEGRWCTSPVRLRNGFVYYVRFKMIATACRVWAGLFDNAAWAAADFQNDARIKNHVALRMSPAVGPNFYASTADGAVQTATDLGFAFASGTLYELYLVAPYAGAMSPTLYICGSGGVIVQHMPLLNLPAAGTAIRAGIAVHQTGVPARAVDVYDQELLVF